MQRLEKILAPQTAPKVPEWPSFGNFRKVTEIPHFLKKGKGGIKKHFSKIAQKVALWRKWHYRLIRMHLKCKDWKRFWRKKRLQRVPEWPSYGNFCKVTQNPHFPKKVQRGDQGKFLKNRPKISPRLKGLKALCRK